MEEIEVPQYFICPISLQIMEDPVTTITGITYEREAIQHWLRTAEESTCPMTKQPLPQDSDLTPNHTLQRLIQAWRVSKAAKDSIPTPKSLLDKNCVLKLLEDVERYDLYAISLRKIESLVKESEENRKLMVESGVAEAMVSFITNCYKENRACSVLEQALSILRLVWSPSSEIKALVNRNQDFIDSLTWILPQFEKNTVLVLKSVMEVANRSQIERLKLEFFEGVVRVLRNRVSVKSALKILLISCVSARNKLKIIEANAVFHLVELEFEKPEKSVSEMVFSLLANLCSCADGRAEFLCHAGSIAMVSKRILRVSAVVDEYAVQILALVSRFCATEEVVLEMLRVGGVTKLCMVIQADCAAVLKEKARGILRMHSGVWSDSPCIALYLLTWHSR